MSPASMSTPAPRYVNTSPAADTLVVGEGRDEWELVRIRVRVEVSVCVVGVGDAVCVVVTCVIRQARR